MLTIHYLPSITRSLNSSIYPFFSLNTRTSDWIRRRRVSRVKGLFRIVSVSLIYLITLSFRTSYITIRIVLDL